MFRGDIPSAQRSMRDSELPDVRDKTISRRRKPLMEACSPCVVLLLDEQNFNKVDQLQRARVHDIRTNQNMDTPALMNNMPIAKGPHDVQNSRVCMCATLYTPSRACMTSHISHSYEQ